MFPSSANIQNLKNETPEIPGTKVSKVATQLLATAASAGSERIAAAIATGENALRNPASSIPCHVAPTYTPANIIAKMSFGGRVCEIQQDSSLVMVTRGDTLAACTAKLNAYKSLPDNINAPKVIDVVEQDGRVWEIMERAPGAPVHTRKFQTSQEYQLELEILANAPQEHFDKFLADMKALHSAGLAVDPSKTDNFFYEPAHGFSFIDLSVSDYKNNEYDFIQIMIGSGHKTEATIENAQIILGKMEKAGFDLEDHGTSHLAWLRTQLGQPEPVYVPVEFKPAGVLSVQC